MAYRKCPRCNLNYIQATEQFCPVCLRETGRRTADDAGKEFCSECGVNYVLKGKDMCAECLTKAHVAAQKPWGATFQTAEAEQDEPAEPGELDEVF